MPIPQISQKCAPGFRGSFRAEQRRPTRAKNSRFGNDKFRVRVTAGGPCPPPRPDAEAGKPAPLFAKFIAVSRGLKGILDYVTNREKTVDSLISGVNCVAEMALDEFEAVKK